SSWAPSEPAASWRMFSTRSGDRSIHARPRPPNTEALFSTSLIRDKTTRMNEQQSNPDTEAVAAALPARQRPPFHPAQSRRLCNAQFALSAAPRRQTCLNSPRQNGQWIWTTEPPVEIEIQRERKTLPPLSLAEVWACHRKMRIALSFPPRRSCLTKHAMI